MSEAVETEVQPVTFYSWLGNDEHGRAYPASQVIHISGGVSKLAGDGQKIMTTNKEAPFNKGRFTTADPEIIEALRSKIRRQPACGISENVEEFYAKTMTPQQKANRGALIAQQQAGVVAEQAQEINRLKQLLEKKGEEELPKRKSA